MTTQTHDYEYGNFITIDDRTAVIRKAEQAIDALRLWPEMRNLVWNIVASAVDDLIDGKPTIERIVSIAGDEETRYSEYHAPKVTPIDTPDMGDFTG